MKKPNIPEPSVANVQKAVDQWNNDEVSYGFEKSLDKFFKEHPNNNNRDEVFFKICSVNDIYATKLTAGEIYKIAAHIVANAKEIDGLLKDAKIDAVEKIANVEIGKGKTKNFYSFASKYCSFHKYKNYALYDRNADETLWYFKNKDKFSNFKRCELRNYKTYMNVIADFQEHYGLEKFTLRELDHYLWSTGSKLLNNK